MIIAIDGPAGAGKSTVCRILAQQLHFLYLDTGAMYRAVAWSLSGQGEADLQEDLLTERLSNLPLSFGINGQKLEILLKDRPLENELRSPEMSEMASRISRLKPVREFLLLWQRKLAEQGDIVAEGRDTATVVFPNAELKVFLTAEVPTRTQRRLAEYTQKGITISYEEMEKRIRERDEADSNRELAPMRPAEGAMLLDTSDLDIPEVVERLAKAALERKEAATH